MSASASDAKLIPSPYQFNTPLMKLFESIANEKLSDAERYQACDVVIDRIFAHSMHVYFLDEKEVTQIENWVNKKFSSPVELKSVAPVSSIWSQLLLALCKSMRYRIEGTYARASEVEGMTHTSIQWIAIKTILHWAMPGPRFDDLGSLSVGGFCGQLFAERYLPVMGFYATSRDIVEVFSMEESAKALCERGVQLNHAPSLYGLGKLLLTGDSARARGLSYIERAVAQEYPPALVALGEWYENTSQRNRHKAKECYEKAAQQKNFEGWYHLGRMHEVVGDIEQAALCYRNSAILNIYSQKAVNALCELFNKNPSNLCVMYYCFTCAYRHAEYEAYALQLDPSHMHECEEYFRKDMSENSFPEIRESVVEKFASNGGIIYNDSRVPITFKANVLANKLKTINKNQNNYYFEKLFFNDLKNIDPKKIPFLENINIVIALLKNFTKVCQLYQDNHFPMMDSETGKRLSETVIKQFISNYLLHVILENMRSQPRVPKLGLLMLIQLAKQDRENHDVKLVEELLKNANSEAMDVLKQTLIELITPVSIVAADQKQDFRASVASGDAKVTPEELFLELQKDFKKIWAPADVKQTAVPGSVSQLGSFSANNKKHWLAPLSTLLLSYPLHVDAKDFKKIYDEIAVLVTRKGKKEDPLTNEDYQVLEGIQQKITPHLSPPKVDQAQRPAS